MAELAARIIEPPGACGFTLRRGGGTRTVTSSSELAKAIGDAQYESGAGPGPDSLASGRLLDVPDLTTESRWPGFRSRALELGVRSCLVVPLTDGTEILGALNLYGHPPHVFDAVAHQQARTFAAQASTALVLVLHSAAQAEQSAQADLPHPSRRRPRTAAPAPSTLSSPTARWWSSCRRSPA